MVGAAVGAAVDSVVWAAGWWGVSDIASPFRYVSRICVEDMCRGYVSRICVEDVWIGLV
jgi:hypothetical protein